MKNRSKIKHKLFVKHLIFTFLKPSTYYTEQSVLDDFILCIIASNATHTSLSSEIFLISKCQPADVWHLILCVLVLFENWLRNYLHHVLQNFVLPLGTEICQIKACEKLDSVLKPANRHASSVRWCSSLNSLLTSVLTYFSLENWSYAFWEFPGKWF